MGHPEIILLGSSAASHRVLVKGVSSASAKDLTLPRLIPENCKSKSIGWVGRSLTSVENHRNKANWMKVRTIESQPSAICIDSIRGVQISEDGLF
jgi:hypothetical protein